MSFEEYATTEHSQTVPRWSILAIPPEAYTRTQLCQLGKEALSALAYVWSVKRDGSKEQLADRIIRRVQFRSMLARESEISLATRNRNDLISIAQEAGVYHPWLNRKDLAACLIQWRENTRRCAKIQIAKAQHERIVRTAARKGLYVPPDNLSQYGLDADGHREPTILGVPLSRALRFAPEAVTAARSLTTSAFREWVKANRDLSSKLVFIEAGILGDSGDLFWREVQRAFALPEVPPLFAGKEAEALEPTPVMPAS
jgi:hypothetical protein